MIAVCDQKIVFKNAGDTVEQRTDTGGKSDGKHTGRNALPQCKIVQMNGYVFTFSYDENDIVNTTAGGADQGCDGSTRNSHAKHKNKDRIQNDV